MYVRAPWVNHFGFTKTPFGKSIPAKNLFARQAQDEAVARIRFCISEAALGVITGEVGIGKTVAVRAATDGLDPTSHLVVYIANPAFGTRGLYLAIVSALGGQPRFSKAELMAQAQTLLAAEEHERHRRVVLIVDEAHLLSPVQLEELRLLTNADMDSRTPFAMLLVGQPTLARQLRMGVFAAYVAVVIMLRWSPAAGRTRWRAGEARRHNHSPCRNVRTSSVGRYRPARTFAGAVRARARSLSAMSA
jgi:type II secretory pathway predicted ATPase ExeA